MKCIANVLRLQSKRRDALKPTVADDRCWPGERHFTAVPVSHRSGCESLPAKVSFTRRRLLHAVGHNLPFANGRFQAVH